MDENKSFIKLHRKMLKWEWYNDTNTKVLFIHCLLKANWKDGRFEGYEIPRGSFITSVKKLSEELSNKNQKFSIQAVRTSLKHLISTNELTIKTTSKFSIITVNNYELYQENNKVSNNQLTINQQSTNNQLTTIEEYKNIRNIRNISNSSNICEFVEENFGRTLNSIECETILGWQDNELTRYAIKIAVLNGVPRVKYIQGILDSYKAKNIKTVLEAQEEEKNFKNSRRHKQIKDEPFWLNKKIEMSPATKEEQEEIENMLKEFKRI